MAARTAPFSLREIREAANRYGRQPERGPGGVPTPGPVVTPDAVLALVDIAYAARDYFARSLPYSDDPDARRAQEVLREELRRVHDERYA